MRYLPSQDKILWNILTNILGSFILKEPNCVFWFERGPYHTDCTIRSSECV